MADLDWICCAVLALSLSIGAWRGLVYEVLSVVNWVLAFVLAQWAAPSIAQLLPMHGASDMVRYGAGFFCSFILCLLAGSVLVFLTKKVVHVSGMGLVDRLLGLAFGSLRAMVILLIAAMALRMTPLARSDWWLQAYSPRIAQSVLSGLKPWLPQAFSPYLP
jgi:membrane protein required for colicin V production